jgi:hypothetical protein
MAAWPPCRPRGRAATGWGVPDYDAAEIPWDFSKFVGLLGVGDHMAHRAAADTVGKVVGPQRGRSRHDHRAQLHDRQHRLPQPDLVAQHDHHAIAVIYPGRGQRCGQPIRALGHLGERIRVIGPVFVDDAQRGSSIAFGDRVEPVQRPIELVPHVGPAERLHRGVMGVAVAQQYIAGSAAGFSPGCSVHRYGLLT